jgi:hypothetical protein
MFGPLNGGGIEQHELLKHMVGYCALMQSAAYGDERWGV